MLIYRYKYLFVENARDNCFLGFFFFLFVGVDCLFFGSVVRDRRNFMSHNNSLRVADFPGFVLYRFRSELEICFLMEKCGENRSYVTSLNCGHFSGGSPVTL